MAFTIFYAWQSDRPKKINLDFIGDAIIGAAEKLNKDPEIIKTVGKIVIDQDTKGETGSPHITETILKKIKTCNAFLADFTIIPTAKGCKPTPNPNVLIEYGYALSNKSYQQIIPVMNTAFGGPEILPFDLKHRRVTIQYSLQEAETKEKITSEKKDVIEEIQNQISGIIYTLASKTEGQKASKTEVPTLRKTTIQPKAGKRKWPKIQVTTYSKTLLEEVADLFDYYQEEQLGIFVDGFKHDADIPIAVPKAAYLFLALRPTDPFGSMSNVDSLSALQKTIEPLSSRRSSGWNYGRNKFGGVAYTFAGDDLQNAWSFSQLTREAMVLGADYYHLSPEKVSQQDFLYIPTQAIEEILIDGLGNYLEAFENKLEIQPPLDLIVGMKGVENYKLAVDPNYFGHSKFVGKIFDNEIIYGRPIKDYEVSPYEMLLPFFKKYYDAAGIQRPDVPTKGRRY